MRRHRATRGSGLAVLAASLCGLLSGCDASLSVVANRPPTRPKVAEVTMTLKGPTAHGAIADEGGSCGVVDTSAASSASGAGASGNAVSIYGFQGNPFVVGVTTILAQPGTDGLDTFLVLIVTDHQAGTYPSGMSAGARGSAIGLLSRGGATNPFLHADAGQSSQPILLSVSGSITIDPGEASGSVDLKLVSADFRGNGTSALVAAVQAAVSAPTPEFSHLTGTFRCVDLTHP